MFRNIDTNRPDGAYVAFSRRVTSDDHFTPDDWAPGLAKEARRKLASGVWIAVGVQAVASITVVQNKTGTLHTLTSAGLWGVVVPSAADPYLATIYAEELAELRAQLAMFGSLIEVTAGTEADEVAA